MSPALRPQAPPLTPPCTPPPRRVGPSVPGRRLFASPEGRKRRLSCGEPAVPLCELPGLKTPTRSTSTTPQPPRTPGTPLPDLPPPPSPDCRATRLRPRGGDSSEEEAETAPRAAVALRLAAGPRAGPPREGCASPLRAVATAPDVSLAVGLQCVAALMRQEPWYTLEDPEDPHARLFELQLWKAVKMIGPLDEEECALDPWGGLAGSRDSLEALQLRLRRLVWCLDSDADSLALLDKLCAASPMGAEPLAVVVQPLAALVPQRPFLPLKAGRLPALRGCLLAAGADAALLGRAADQGASLAALAPALDRLLDRAAREEWRAAEKDPQAADRRQALAQQHEATVQAFNTLSRAVVRAFTR
eukprot:EG_transcript_14304